MRATNAPRDLPPKGLQAIVRLVSASSSGTRSRSCRFRRSRDGGNSTMANPTAAQSTHVSPGPGSGQGPLAYRKQSNGVGWFVVSHRIVRWGGRHGLGIPELWLDGPLAIGEKRTTSRSRCRRRIENRVPRLLRSHHLWENWPYFLRHPGHPPAEKQKQVLRCAYPTDLRPRGPGRAPLRMTRH